MTSPYHVTETIAMIRGTNHLTQNIKMISVNCQARGGWGWVLLWIGIFCAMPSHAYDLSENLYESDIQWLWNNDGNGNKFLPVESEPFRSRNPIRYYYSARQITITNPKKEVSDPTLLMHDGSADTLIVEDLKRRMLGDNPKRIPASATWSPISQKLYGRAIDVKDGPFLAAVRNWVNLGGSSTVSIPNLTDFKAYLESIGIQFGHLGPVHPKTPPNELYYNEKAGILLIHATRADFELIDEIIRWPNSNR
jgi:hypothetical protein